MRSFLRWAVVPFIFFVDRILKILVLGRFHEGESLPLWKGVFYLTLVKNAGSAFGFWKDLPFVPVVVTVLASAAIFMVLFRTKNFYGWALVLGGALGNLYDRLVFGHVIDFLDFRIWPVFNFADACICAGIFILLWDAIRKKHASDSV